MDLPNLGNLDQLQQYLVDQIRNGATERFNSQDEVLQAVKG